MKPSSLFAVGTGLLLFGGCSLVQSGRWQEQADAVPTMTCDELISNGPRGNRFVRLIDVRLCSRGDVVHRDMDAALQMYVPIYSSRLPQEPPPRDLALVLEVLDERDRKRVLARRDAIELTCELWRSVDQLDLWARRGLENKYPGIQLAQCRVVSVGLHEPTLFKARQTWWYGIVSLAAGAATLAYSVWKSRI